MTETPEKTPEPLPPTASSLVMDDKLLALTANQGFWTHPEPALPNRLATQPRVLDDAQLTVLQTVLQNGGLDARIERGERGHYVYVDNPNPETPDVLAQVIGAVNAQLRRQGVTPREVGPAFDGTLNTERFESHQLRLLKPETAPKAAASAESLPLASTETLAILNQKQRPLRKPTAKLLLQPDGWTVSYSPNRLTTKPGLLNEDQRLEVIDLFAYSGFPDTKVQRTEPAEGAVAQEYVSVDFPARLSQARVDRAVADIRQKVQKAASASLFSGLFGSKGR